MAEQDTITKPEEEVSWQYKSDNHSDTDPEAYPERSGTAPPPSGGSRGTVSWTASEYIEHHHGPGWYMALLWATGAATAGVYFLTKEYFATGVIAVVGIIVAVFASRKPQQIKYELSDSGLRVGQKLYNYNLFKSFSVVKEGGFSSLNLSPLKRFMPPVSAHFETKDEEKIISAISDFLPYEQHKVDQIDRLSRKLRL
jgi:hypothetical protein